MQGPLGDASLLLTLSVEEVIVYPASHDVVFDATIECNTADIGYLDIGAVTSPHSRKSLV